MSISLPFDAAEPGMTKGNSQAATADRRHLSPPNFNELLLRMDTTCTCLLSPKPEKRYRAVMTTPISFTVRPPGAVGYRPSPLGNGNNARQGPPSRRLFEQGDDDEDDDRRSSRHSRESRSNGNGPSSRCVQAWSGLGRTDMYRAESDEKPLVIPALPNRDWRQSARRTPTYRPDAPKRTAEDEVRHERTGDGPQRSGLRRIEREVKVEEVVVKQEPGESSSGPSVTTTTTTANEVHVKQEPLSLEEQALRAVLAGDSQRESEEERAQKELVISAQANTRDVYREISEEEAFKRDIVALPEEVGRGDQQFRRKADVRQSTLDDYEQIPVSAFGLAMARGLGWDPKANDNTSIHEPKKRPQLLGLGATPMDPTIRPTHAKHGSSKKDKQAERNAKTGRGFVATHLFEKRGKDGSPISTESSRAVSPTDSESSKRRRIDNGDSDRDSRRDASDRGSDRDREKDRYRARESDRDRDRDRDRRRNDEYETEDERARRKARERRDRDYETDEERARRKAREREREYETEEERARRKARERERDGQRDRRYDGRDTDRRR